MIAILLAAGQGARLGGPKALLLARPPAAAHEMPLLEAQCRDRLAAESSRALAVVRPDVAARIGDRLRTAGAEVVVSNAPDALGPAGSLAAAAVHLFGDGGVPPAARAGGSPPSTTLGRGGRATRDRGWAPVDGSPPKKAEISGVAPTLPTPRPALVRRPAPPKSLPPVAQGGANQERTTSPLAAVSRGAETGAIRRAPEDSIVLVTPVDVRADRATAASLVGALLAPPLPGSPPPLAAVPRHQGRRGHPVALRVEVLGRYLEADPPPLRDHLRALGDRVLAVDVADPFVLEDLDFAHQTEALARITGCATAVFWSAGATAGP